MRAWISLTLLLAAAMASCAPLAAEPSQSDPCIEGANQTAMPVPIRLAPLRYRCLSLHNGQRVLVGEAGPVNARTVLLVHGLGDNAHRDWTEVVPALAMQFHVVTLDLPGFGGSPASPHGYSFTGLGEILAEVLDGTAPGQRVHMVGHSLGAALSLYFAHKHPLRVDRLVLVDAAGILLKNVFVQHMVRAQVPKVGLAPVDRLLGALDERIKVHLGQLFDLDERIDFSQWLEQNPGIRRALIGRHTHVEAALSLVEHDFTVAISETTAPTTVIWGSNDPVAPLRTGKLLAGRMPDARLEVIQGVGHVPMVQSPSAFNRLLLAGLTAPRVQTSARAVTGASQGSVVCENRTHARYSGVFDSITLENCRGVQIEDARIRQVTLSSSSLSMENAVIDGADVALSVRDSEVAATNVRIRGRVAIRAERSRLDLAGVSLRASQRVVEMPAPSRMFFSVSDWHGTDHDGNAHFAWPHGAGKR